MYQVHTEKKLQHHSEIEIQCPCDKKYKNECFSDECYHLFNEEIVG